MSELKLKVGDKVKLLRDSSILTTGKIYEIIKNDQGYFWILTDKGTTRYINPDSTYWEIVKEKDINYLELLKGY